MSRARDMKSYGDGKWGLDGEDHEGPPESPFAKGVTIERPTGT